MPSHAPVVHLDMEFSAGVWTEVTTDVHFKHDVTWQRGIFGSGPEDLVARPGTLVFTLKNSAANSGSTRGWYSPFGASARAGFQHGTRVRLRIVAGTEIAAGAGVGMFGEMFGEPFGGGAGGTATAVAPYVFMGELKTIQPLPGTTGKAETFCIAEDYMAKFAEEYDMALTLRQSGRSDQGISDVVALFDRAPENTDYETGRDTYDYLFDDLGAEPVPMTVAQNICRSERGPLYVRGNNTDGETLRFENRITRALAVVDDTFVEGELQSLDVPSDLGRVFNDVQITTYPRVEGASLVTVISLAAPVLVAARQTRTVSAKYRDPGNEDLAGAVNVVTPVSTTDYTANTAEDGSGSDVTSDFSIVMTANGSDAEFAITNSGSSSGYLRGQGSDDGMRARGNLLTRYAPEVSSDTNPTSITTYGQRRLRIDMPYQSDSNVGQDAATGLANLYGSTANVPMRMGPITAKPDLLLRALKRDVGDKIVVSETMTGVVAQEVIINAVVGVIRQGVVNIQWVLAPADQSSHFILNDPVAGVLGSSSLGWG